MPTPYIPRTESEVAAHTAHLAGDVVLQHRLTQDLSYATVEALLAVARQDPGLDQGAAKLLVQQALTTIVEVEIRSSRRVAA